MSSVNKVILIGNLGKDPEIKTMGNGKEVANLTIATSEKWKDKSTGEKKEKTEWTRVVVFNEGLVRLCKQYISKGTKLYIEGKLETRKWQDASGVDKYSTEVVLQAYNGSIVMLDSKGGNNTQSEPSVNKESSSTGFTPDDLESEIPF